ncbi:PAS domain S-box protein [Halorubrum trueperi]|uniref:histidine kinase n=1 Tax=Halorubrum trueperi TaxID=2004704 RepID=A0ABD5UK99_9EURY
MEDRIRVLHVDDDPDLTELVSSFLEREDDRIAVETASNATEALAWIAERDIDCIVSDHDMPGPNGIEFLEAVRDRDADLPFILYTGKGSESVASEAISADVTDYIQKESGTEQYELLANRIVDAVEKCRLEREAERTKAFVEHSSDIVSVLDADGTFRYLSPSIERVLGFEPDELIGEHAFEYVHPDDRESVVEVFNRSLTDVTGNPTVEYRLRCSDGGYRWVESIGSNRLDEHAVGGYVINTRDISNRKRREEKLTQLREWTHGLNYTRTVEETTRLAVDAVDEIVGAELSGIHLLNDEGDALEPNALAESVPAFFDELPSYDRAAPPGTRAALAWEAYASDEPIAIGELSTSGRIDEDTPAESLVLHPIGGHGLFVISASTANAFTETDVLIAEILANHLEAALDRVARESRLERLHDATRSLIRAGSREEIADRVIDAADEVLGFSVATVRLYDEDAGGLVPVAVSQIADDLLPPRGIFTPDDGSLNWGAFDAGEPAVYDDIETAGALDSGTGLRSLMILPIGEYGTISIGETEAGVFDGTDEFLAKILATAAETAFQSEARTRRLHQRSAELERQNDRLEEFASVVSHDLRNPLNVAQGRVELARDDCDSEHLDIALAAHERMDTLIADLLTLAREGERVNETHPVRLSAVFESCWANVDTANAELIVERDLTFRADESRLQQVLENLIRNAVEHGGDDVIVRVGSLDGANGFFVEDDGPGIQPEERETVFDVGYSTSDAGTGFGLRIVEQVADAHGWNVEVTAERSGGARFEVTGVETVD